MRDIQTAVSHGEGAVYARGQGNRERWGTRLEKVGIGQRGLGDVRVRVPH